MLDGFAIDDGNHRPKIIPDDDASVAAGAARYAAECSCGRWPRKVYDDRHQALSGHLAHVTSRLGPSKGPGWLPVGLRLFLLAAAMMLVWAASFATGHVIGRSTSNSGLVLAAFHLLGLGLAFGLMVAVRRYIAPTRD
ncbi:hypothetical protein AB0952_09205 [Streptomyces caniferus]|uniref:hypothetical protein n=1 Tax=Streptomyces caniferus TaxID=285557 RepID=UPI003452EE35